MINRKQRERKEDFMMKNERIYKLVLTALMAALSYVVFTFLQIKIALPGGDATSLHLGNAVCVLGALLLGGVYGGNNPDTVSRWLLLRRETKPVSA